LRRSLAKEMLNRKQKLNKEQRKWIEERKLFLRKFGEQLFHVYKEQYVR